MKNKILAACIACTLMSIRASAQDSTRIQTEEPVTTHIEKPCDCKTQQQQQAATIKEDTDKLYRPTRLGSSSPLYNTYEKNAYGAGYVTTHPK